MVCHCIKPACGDDCCGCSKAISDEERHVLVHALTGGTRKVYRNHFVTGPGSDDYPLCERLTALGLMSKRPGHPLSGGDPVYSVTATGAAAVRKALP